MNTTAGKLVLGAVGCVLAVAGVFWLRSATISTVERVPRDSSIVVMLEAHSRGGERVQTLAERVEALLLTCRVEVRSDLAGPIEQIDDHHFVATFVPTMDRTDQRQFSGCVQDWLIDGVQADIESMEEHLPEPE